MSLAVLFQDLKEMRLRLVKEKARLVGTCEELRSYLESMWKRLDKPTGEQDEFLKTCEGFTPKALELLEVNRVSIFSTKM